MDIHCPTCGAYGEQPCHKMWGGYWHPLRYRKVKKSELERKRMVRENYLGNWLREYGDIFQIS